ncbi:hypothetical protein AMATHDRAFT_4640 [Amanita thiersii Skay4041]|uniref:Uncharacterized protein n=1 Tax=Amanita thiersii Skay4041 TaxID=703135 RepID=A0A2A9NFB6_9AGAR|nr:hypothetical protein AMATHDRAFT_4640 [Amanita thiersii Skay4041]
MALPASASLPQPDFQQLSHGLTIAGQQFALLPNFVPVSATTLNQMLESLKDSLLQAQKGKIGRSDEADGDAHDNSI